MYTNILYVITVLLIFTLYNPLEQAIHAWFWNIAGIVALYTLFFIYSRTLFRALEKRSAGNAAGLSTFAARHSSLIQRTTIIAIFLYSICVYSCNLKSLILLVPYLKDSAALSGIAGIIPFFCLLLIVWKCAYPSYRRFYHPELTLRDYVSSHIKLNSIVIVPWLVVSLVVDIFNLLVPGVYSRVEQNPVASLAFMGIMLAAISVYFPAVMIRLWSCKPVPSGPMRQRIEDFCQRSHFKYHDILLWNLFDGRLVTAGVIGFIKRFRYILISPVLLNMLDEDEIESVIAHEIGHVKQRHMVYYFYLLMGYLAVVYSVFEQVSYNMLSTDFILNIIVSGAESSNTIISILLTLLPLGLFIVYFRFIFGYFSRSFERQSDLYALKLKGTSAGIINSLEKIAWVSSINKYAPNWHHYGIYERIKFLQQCAAQPSLIGRHDRKVSVMLIAYTLVLIGLSSVLYGSNAQNLQHSKITFVQKVLEKQVQQYPANPLYQFSLGNLYFEIGKIKEAEIYYKNALALNPDDPEVLNNLAWLYATARDAEFRNPQEALSLSKKAAALDPKPHILDTLGESYYINGQYAEAVNALELAIRKKPDNIEYYKKQLNKFKKSLDQQGEEDSDQDQQPEDDDQRFAI